MGAIGTRRDPSGSARKLAYLGDRPLGAALFSTPTTRRQRVEMARVLPRHPLFAAAVDHLDGDARELWGRRTLFQYADKPLVVNEIFLPDIPALIDPVNAPYGGTLR